MAERDKDVLLTLDDVRQMKAERDACAVEYHRLGERLAELDDNLQSAARFLKPDLRAAIMAETRPANAATPEVERNGNRRKWAPTIISILRESPTGMLSNQLREALRLTPLADDMAAHGNALYNALVKMIHKGELVKTGLYYCLPGQPPGEDPGRPKTERVTAFIYDLLSTSKHGLTAGEIVERMSLESEFKDILKASPSIAYTLLSRLNLHGKLTREGGKKYRIAGSELDRLLASPEQAAEPPTLFKPRVVA